MFYVCAMASPYSEVIGLLYAVVCLVVVYTTSITTSTNCRDGGECAAQNADAELEMLDLDDERNSKLGRSWVGPLKYSITRFQKLKIFLFLCQ